MGKFGFGKKDEGGDDSNRSALFGSRSKNNKSPNPQTNPYADLPTQSDPYNQAKARAYDQRGSSPAPPSVAPGHDPRGYPDDKKSGGYGGMNNGPPRGGAGYGADKYGAQGGYGGDRYGSGNGGLEPNAGASRCGPGGYGGLGRTPSQATTSTDDNRDALFGGAKDRVQKQSNQQMGYGAPPPYEGPEGQEGGYGGSSGPSHEAYGDRQLTAEEEEEEDVTATKQQMRFIKQEDVSSTRNALRIAAQAEESGVRSLR